MTDRDAATQKQNDGQTRDRRAAGRSPGPSHTDAPPQRDLPQLDDDDDQGQV